MTQWTQTICFLGGTFLLFNACSRTNSPAQTKHPNSVATALVATKPPPPPPTSTKRVRTTKRATKRATRALPKPTPSAFAAVELFTSEGCSSCPPAERLMGYFGKQARKYNKRLYPIVYHVDYWDHLGWRDRFGKRAFTKLQQLYSRAFGRPNLYTPQMIVNGRWEFVGSHGRTAASAIKRALLVRPKAGITLCVERKQTRRLHGRFRVHPLPTNARLDLIVTERGLITRVTRGENAGRKLPADEVARAFQSRSLHRSTGNFNIGLPRGLRPKHSALVALLRHKRSFRILAARQVRLGTPNKCP